MKLPKAFQKKDGNWYCHYNGKQHYLGKNPDEKIRKLVAAVVLLAVVVGWR